MKDRLRKIYELSVRGIDGERENAQALLIGLLGKHGLTLDDILDTDKRHHYDFRYKNEFERSLLNQIVARVLGTNEFGVWRRGKQRLNIYDLTASECAEVQLMYDEYRRALADELELTYRGFIQQQRLFAPRVADEDRELSREEIKEARRVLSRAADVERVSIRRKLGAGA